jgi:hypothetical protein
MQRTPSGAGNGQSEQQRADEWRDQQKRTNERIGGQIEHARKSLERQAELVEQARQQRQQQDERDRQQQGQQQAAQRRETPNGTQDVRRLVIRNAHDENKPHQQQQQRQSDQRERPTQEQQDAPRETPMAVDHPLGMLKQPPPPSFGDRLRAAETSMERDEIATRERDSRSQADDARAMPLEDAASYALRRDEEHLDRQDLLGSMIEESSDPVERERLTLVKDAEHHAYSADQIDRILDMQTRLDRVAGTNVSSSPEYARLRERGTEHRAALGETMQALERHNAQHPPKDRPQASTHTDITPHRSADAASSEASSTPSPRPNFSERAAARREAAEAQGATLPQRDPTPAASASNASAPARTADESRVRSR